MAYTTTQYLSNVKIRGGIPTSQNTFTAARLLALGDAEIRSYILPLILKSREHYYDYDIDTSLNATGIYDISTRAVGGTVINACLLDSTNRYDLNWIEEDNLTQTDNTDTGSPGIFIKKNQIHLVPPDPSYTTFRYSIAIRPGTLIETDDAAQITAIDTATKTLTFAASTIPNSWTTSNTFDLIQNKAHFDHLAIDQAVTSITSTTIVFSSTLPTRLVVGDWVSLAEESAVIQIPVELQPLLEQKVANTCMRAQGYIQAMENGEKELTRMEKDIVTLFSPRIKENARVIVNRSGILRRR